MNIKIIKINIERILITLERIIKGSKHTKLKYEFSYWKYRKKKGEDLSNKHYEYFYTAVFGFDKSFYKDKKILDIGCGPRGSLEWADLAKERVGLDPLADSYLDLGVHKHKMHYVNAPAEKIPFPDNYFDVVCSFNSLDHVDDMGQVMKEIIRVLAPKGVFLLITEVNHRPTSTEPQSFSFDVVKIFLPNFKLVEERHYEKSGGVYRSVKLGIPYDRNNKKRRTGLLLAKLYKN